MKAYIFIYYIHGRIYNLRAPGSETRQNKKVIRVILDFSLLKFFIFIIIKIIFKNCKCKIIPEDMRFKKKKHYYSICIIIIIIYSSIFRVEAFAWDRK